MRTKCWCCNPSLHPRPELHYFIFAYLLDTLSSIETKKWCFIPVLVVLHDVMGSYQLVAPNWRPLTLGQRSSGPGSDTGQRWRPRSVSSGAWCCLDTQGYLMMLGQQQPTTSNIITNTNIKCDEWDRKGSHSIYLDLAMESWKVIVLRLYLYSLHNICLQGVAKKVIGLWRWRAKIYCL